MAGILPSLGRRVEEIRAPEVADRFAVAPEHVQHRHLGSLCGLAEIVAVVGVAGRGHQPQPPPAALFRIDKDARKLRLRDEREIDALRDVLRGTLERIEKGCARTTGTAARRRARGNIKL